MSYPLEGIGRIPWTDLQKGDMIYWSAGSGEPEAYLVTDVFGAVRLWRGVHSIYRS